MTKKTTQTNTPAPSIAYPVKLRHDALTGLTQVEYFDFDKVHTSGDNEEHALREAIDGISCGIMMLMDEGQPIPVPSAVEGEGIHWVQVSAEDAAKVAAYMAERFPK